MDEHEILARRAFTLDDQRAFAAFCGDINPMHMDATAARRTQAGAPVVHGMHVAMWALDVACKKKRLAEIGNVRAHFGRFLLVGEEVLLRFERVNPTRFRLHVASNERSICSISVRVECRGEVWNGIDGPVSELPPVPRVLALQDALKQQGRFTLLDGATSMFPALTAVVGGGAVSGLGALSALVGMVCPGMHSIFSAFEVDISGVADGASLDWRVVDADDRVCMTSMQVAAPGFVGSVEAFFRFAPQYGPSFSSLVGRVASERFALRKALVVGGSRGLGAAIAKLLAVGGAQVVVTYARGAADAQAVVDDIVAGTGRALAMQLDVERPLSPQLATFDGDFSHLYYCATPHIGYLDGADFSIGAFDRYCRYYVSALAELLLWRSGTGQARFTALCPSSVYVTEPPRGLVEYAAAKAAGERVARDLAQALCFDVLTPRLPRILTDQTATVPPVMAEDPMDVVLPFLLTERG